jgi:hypothetical protein
VTRGRLLGLVVSGALVAAGALWTLQGLGYVEAAGMTGSNTWSIIGPLVAGFGVALGIVVLQKRE